MKLKKINNWPYLALGLLTAGTMAAMADCYWYDIHSSVCGPLRHIYDPLVGPSPGSDVTVETVSVTAIWELTSFHLEGGGSSYTWQ
jgi:hypothetical protein